MAFSGAEVVTKVKQQAAAVENITWNGNGLANIVSEQIMHNLCGMQSLLKGRSIKIAMLTRCKFHTD